MLGELNPIVGVRASVVGSPNILGSDNRAHLDNAHRPPVDCLCTEAVNEATRFQYQRTRRVTYQPCVSARRYLFGTSSASVISFVISRTNHMMI